jgi:hypothetical protein
MPRAKLSNVSLKQLVAELERRKARLAALIAQRDAMSKEIEELQSLAGVGTVAAVPEAPARRGPQPGRKRRAKRATGKPLAQYVSEALAAAKKGLRITEMEKSVLAAGYPTKAKSLYKAIGNLLAKGGFKRVAKGIYVLKGRPGRPKKVARAISSLRKGKRGTFSETSEEFVLGLVKGKGATTHEINKAWLDVGRGAIASPTLSNLFKARKIKREPLKDEKGFLYTLA